MQKRKIKITILSICTLLMSAGLIAGILGEIAKHYANVEVSVIQMVLTLPFLVATVFALLAGPLSAKISKKTLILIAFGCLFSGCLLAFFFGGADIKALLASSILLGISQGMLVTLSMALVADYFEGQERGALMGLSSAFVNFGGMIVTFVAALLSGIAWNYSYLAILLAVIPFFIVILFLPKDAPVRLAESASDEKGKLNFTVFFNVITVFLYGVFMFVFQANIAIYLDINQLGDARIAGIVNTVLVAGGGVTGLVYGRLYKTLKGYVLPVGLAVAVGALIQLYFIGNLVSVCITAACLGYSLTSVMPTALFNASSAVKPSFSATAIAMVNCSMNVGIFASPIAISCFSVFVGKEDVRGNFIIGAAGLALVAVFYLIANTAVAGRRAVAMTQ